MDQYNKIQEIKDEFINLLGIFNKLQGECLEKYNKISNINDRVHKIETCLEYAEKNIIDFKAKHNLSTSHNYDWETVTEINKLEQQIPKEQLQKEFPLSENQKWREQFDKEFAYSGNYMQTYFRTNSYLLNKQTNFVKKSCWNSNTYDGTGIKADELLRCIERSRKLDGW